MGSSFPPAKEGPLLLPFHANAVISSTFARNVRCVIDHSSCISSIIMNAPWQVRRWGFLAEVRVQEGEPLENALRRFKRKVQQEDIIKEVKRHSYYLKPGEKRRVKAALARKRNRKKARKEQD
jgi:small subunit ribosomal protein S21